MPNEEIIYHYRCSFDNGYTAQDFYIKTNKIGILWEEHDKLVKDFLKNPALGRTACNSPSQFVDCLKHHGYTAEIIEENHPKMPFNKDGLPYLHNISGNY